MEIKEENLNERVSKFDKLKVVPKKGASFVIKLTLFSLINIAILGFFLYQVVSNLYLLIALLIFISFPTTVFTLLYLALDGAVEFLESAKELNLNLSEKYRQLKTKELIVDKKIGFFDIVSFAQNVYTIYQIGKDSGEILELIGMEKLLISPSFLMFLFISFIFHILFTIFSFGYLIWFIF